MYVAPADKPTIKVLYATGEASGEVLRQLQYGMEEEGIPYDLIPAPRQTALELAWEAAGQSRLEVGVGVDGDEVVLHFAKLKAEKPLFQVSAGDALEKIRRLGSNAARMVKKLPFQM